MGGMNTVKEGLLRGGPAAGDVDVDDGHGTSVYTAA